MPMLETVDTLCIIEVLRTPYIHTYEVMNLYVKHNNTPDNFVFLYRGLSVN